MIISSASGLGSLDCGQGHAETTPINVFATDSTAYLQGILLPPAGCCVLSSSTPWCGLWRTMGWVCGHRSGRFCVMVSGFTCVVVVRAGPVVLTCLPQHHTRNLTGLIYHSFQLCRGAQGPASQCNRCKIRSLGPGRSLEESIAPL